MKMNSTQKHIIRVLFLHGSDSRKFLSRELGLSQAALTLSVRPLLEEGLLLESGKVQTGKAGRTEELLSLNPEYGTYLGVDIRSNHYIVSMMDFKGNLIFEDRMEKTQDLAVFLKASAFSNRLLGVGVTHHGSRESLVNEKRVETIKETLDHLGVKNYQFTNNVQALADVYHLFHMEEQNFLLIKYGPGLGSAIYVNGEKIRRKNGSTSEIGHAYTKEGVTLENSISFETLFQKNVEEKEGADYLLHEEGKANEVIEKLSHALICADALLALDRIVFAGIFLSNESIKRRVCEKIKTFDPEFKEEKVVIYQNYEEFNAKKACIQAFIAQFSKSNNEE